MWIVYQKKGRKVVGMSALCEPDLTKEAALKEVVKGLTEGGSVEKYDALQVQDATQALSLMSTPFHHVAIAESKGKVQATVDVPKAPATPAAPKVAAAPKPPKMNILQLSCDAPDAHPADGMPGIKADGKSFTTVTVRKVDEEGEPQKSRSDNDELYLRTTAGTLVSADGKGPVASVKLKLGEASFRLLSETARRVATVSVFSGDPELRGANIYVEFI